MKVSIITLGCKQNKYESDCMARILLDAGYDVVDGYLYNQHVCCYIYG